VSESSRSLVDLSGRTYLVTGAGRRRGIGHAICRRLVEAGASVAVTDLVRDDEHRASLDACVAACREVAGVAQRVEGFELDVADAEAFESVADGVAAAFGRIDGLVNNAGTPVGVGSVLEGTLASWNASWSVNLMGMVHGVRAVVPHLPKDGAAAIVNTASIAGLGAVPGLAAYITTKFAVVGFTKAAAADLAPLGVRVNAVCPGMIETDMGDIEIAHEAERRGISLAQSRTDLVADVPVERWGQPSEIADVVAWLLSPAASYVTGVAMPVTGGLAPGL